MDKKGFDDYKHKLEQERALLAAEIKQNEKPADFGSDTEDIDESTDRSEEVGNQLAIVEGLKVRLGEVNHALAKIQKGAYGICERCKKRIGSDILEIDPESRLCKDCKSRQ